MKIKQYLKQPYPIFGNRWKIIISVSFFISFFMYFFQPFGLASLKNEFRTYFEIGYGAITFLVLIFDLFIIPRFFKKRFEPQRWTVFKQMLWQIWILFSIGLFNFLYTSMFLNFLDSSKAFFVFQFYTLLVGIIPVVVITVIIQNRLLVENLKAANEFNADLNLRNIAPFNNYKVCIIADNNKDKFEIDLANLIYIMSTGNYIQIFYENNNILKNYLLRNTLKQTEEQLKDFDTIIKCHRAFLVNKNRIVHVKGNSQGLRLILQGTDEEIPVSRNFSKGLKDFLNRVGKN